MRPARAGITPKNLLKIFTPFERLGAAEMKIEGSGLGLAISKRLVELMGGVMPPTRIVLVKSETLKPTLPYGLTAVPPARPSPPFSPA